MLTRSLFSQPADQLAPQLLGQSLVIKKRKYKIVETEAYCGQEDLACHASKGKTDRTKVMFGPPGYSYVYMIYGMYFMFNIVCHVEGQAHAVLVRAVEPLDQDGSIKSYNGPGKLCKTIGITIKDNNKDLCDPKRSAIYIESASRPQEVIQSTRVGVDYAKHWALKPFRFGDKSSRYLSPPKWNARSASQV